MMFEEYAAKTIGIDFGTNNSVVGVYNTKIEKPLVIENEEGVNSTPSAVLLREPLEFSDVGRSAKERAMLEPVVLSMKLMDLQSAVKGYVSRFWTLIKYYFST